MIHPLERGWPQKHPSVIGGRDLPFQKVDYSLLRVLMPEKWNDWMGTRFELKGSICIEIHFALILWWIDGSYDMTKSATYRTCIWRIPLVWFLNLLNIIDEDDETTKWILHMREWICTNSGDWWPPVAMNERNNSTRLSVLYYSLISIIEIDRSI